MPETTDFTKTASLLVGLGGAGAKVIARIKQLVQETYAGQPQIRDLVHYLAIDTDRFENLDTVTKEQLDGRDGGEFVFLTGYNPREAYRAYQSNPDTMRDLAAWFPQDHVELLKDALVDNGASRSRPVGRFFLYHAREKVRAALERKVDECLKAPEGGFIDTSTLRVLIFCSCCGGTGSSSFLDILYMIHHHLRRRKGIGPFVEAVVMLPDPFVRAATRQVRELGRHLRTNAYAFFREIDYLIKTPDKFNELAMDAASGRRNAPPPTQDGLPPNMPSPLDTVYMVDEGVAEGGLGLFESLPDLYDFTARAAFASQVVPEVHKVIPSRISNTEAMMSGLDNRFHRRLRYAAFGFSEIRYPGDLIVRWSGLRACRDIIELGLVGESYPDIDKEIAAETQRLLADVHNSVLKPLTDALAKVAADVKKRLGSIEQFQKGSKTDWDAVTDTSLRALWTSADERVAKCEADMDLCLHGQESSLHGKFTTMVDGVINSLAGGNGLDFLGRALLGLHDGLEQELEGLRRERRSLEAKADAAKRDTLGGDEKGASSMAQIKKGSAGEQKLEALVLGASEWATRRIDAYAMKLRIELLRRLVGDEGKNHVPMVFSETTKRYQAGTTIQPSILDDRLEGVSQLQRRLIDLANSTRPETLMREYLHFAGSSPTSQFLPDLFSGLHWETDAKVLADYYRLFPGLLRKNDAKRQSDRRALLAEILPVLTTKFGPVSTLCFATEWLAKLQPALREYVEGRIRPSLSNDVIGLLNDLKPEEKDRCLARLHLNANLACRLSWERYVDPKDRSRVQELHFLGGADTKRVSALNPDQAEIFVCPPDRIVEVKIKGIFPFWLSTALVAIESDYHGRDEDVMPHIVHRFNQGDLDIIDPFGVSRRNPLEVFVAMYAMSLRLMRDEDCAKRLGGFLSFADRECKLRGIPRAFIFQEADKFKRQYGLNAVIWEIPEPIAPRGNVLKPAVEQPIVFAEPFLKGTDRMDRVRSYRRQDAVVNNHTRILEVFEQFAETRAELVGACKFVRDAWLGALKEARESAMLERPSQAPGPATANVSFLTRAITILDGVIDRCSGAASQVDDI